MQGNEYCELWWTEGNLPRLTFYRPAGSETIPLDRSGHGEASDAWDAMRNAIIQLEMSGWQLVSTGHPSGGLFFKRHLQ